MSFNGIIVGKSSIYTFQVVKSDTPANEVEEQTNLVPVRQQVSLCGTGLLNMLVM